VFARLILIAAVRRNREADFRRWFHWSAGYAKQLGFTEPSLLKEREGEGYAILEEHESYGELLTLLNHPFRLIAQRRLAPLLEGEAVPGFYYTALSVGRRRASRFVSLVFFPPVRQGADTAFRRWFWRFGDFCAGLSRSHRRSLLWPMQGGNYAAVLEHDGAADPSQRQAGPGRTAAAHWARPLLDGDPRSRSFERLSS
jgi:hypothetical protein